MERTEPESGAFIGLIPSKITYVAKIELCFLQLQRMNRHNPSFTQKTAPFGAVIILRFAKQIIKSLY